MTRTPGMYGRRSPKGARSLALGKYLTGVVPLVPASADYLASLDGTWQMLGNDEAGDCVSVTWANFRYLVTAKLTATPSYPGMEEVWAFYKTQNPQFNPAGTATTDGPGSQYDRGMDIQTALEYLVTHGGPDGVKALGFASVNVADPAEVKAAIAICGAVWTGVNVYAANEQEFSAGQPWNFTAGAQPIGGHSVLTGGYGAPERGALAGDERFITWAQETSFTDAYWANAVEEAWVVIWPEHLGNKEFMAGINMQQFAADYQEITGNPFPAAVTAPKTATSGRGNLTHEAKQAVQEAISKIEEIGAWLRGLL